MEQDLLNFQLLLSIKNNYLSNTDKIINKINENYLKINFQ